MATLCERTKANLQSSLQIRVWISAEISRECQDMINNNYSFPYIHWLSCPISFRLNYCLSFLTVHSQFVAQISCGHRWQSQWQWQCQIYSSLIWLRFPNATQQTGSQSQEFPSPSPSRPGSASTATRPTVTTMTPNWQRFFRTWEPIAMYGHYKPSSCCERARDRP